MPERRGAEPLQEMKSIRENLLTAD